MASFLERLQVSEQKAILQKTEWSTLVIRGVASTPIESVYQRMYQLKFVEDSL